jgi:hypothetical protein
VSIQHRQDEIRRYLLGDPSQPEEERSAIELAYLKNTGRYKDLLEIEDELVDEYVFGRLREEEAALFQNSLKKSSRWRKKVELATALREYAGQRSTTASERAFFGIPMSYRIAAACGVCVLVVAAVLTVYSIRTSRFIRPAPTIAKTEPTSNLQTPPQEIPRVPVPRQVPPAQPTSPTPVLSFVLIPDLVRGNAEQTQVALSRGRQVVQLRMERADEPYTRYEATVSTPEGQNIFHDANLQPRRAGGKTSVTLALSSELLRPGVYILNLKGHSEDGQVDDLDDFTFQVSTAER